MKAHETILRLVRSTKGVATSLIEATATVAVGAVLAGVAVGSAIDAINDSKIQAAIADVQVIGQGVITFYKDNSFFPLFQAGNATGPNDAFFFNLVSRNGTYPTDATTGATWDIPATPVGYPAGNVAGLFGHQLSPTDDAITGHLVSNRINAEFDITSDPGATGTTFGQLLNGDSYPTRGTIPGDPQRGWSGPYIASLTNTDPWGNKYLINVRMLHTGNFPAGGGSQDTEPVSTDPFPKVAVVVISAGPDRALDTPSNQLGEFFTVNNDDIVFRIK